MCFQGSWYPKAKKKTAKFGTDRFELAFQSSRFRSRRSLMFNFNVKWLINSKPWVSVICTSKYALNLFRVEKCINWNLKTNSILFSKFTSVSPMSRNPDWLLGRFTWFSTGFSPFNALFVRVNLFKFWKLFAQYFSTCLRYSISKYYSLTFKIIKTVISIITL